MYSLTENGQGNQGYANRHERFAKHEEVPKRDDASTVRAILRDADVVAKQIAPDELKTKITAILPGATFEMDDLGQIVIRSSTRLRIDPEGLAQMLREKARRYAPSKQGLFRRAK